MRRQRKAFPELFGAVEQKDCHAERSEASVHDRARSFAALRMTLRCDQDDIALRTSCFTWLARSAFSRFLTGGSPPG